MLGLEKRWQWLDRKGRKGSNKEPLWERMSVGEGEFRKKESFESDAALESYGIVSVDWRKIHANIQCIIAN